MTRRNSEALGVVTEATSRKAINAICGKIRKAYADADNLVHEGLLLAITHADNYRDVMPVAQVIDAMPPTARRALAINWVHMSTNIRLRKKADGLMTGNWLTAETQSVKDGNDFLYVDRRIVVKKDSQGNAIGMTVNPLTISATDEIIKELGGEYSFDVIKKFPAWFSDAMTGGKKGQEPGVFTIADADDRVTGLVQFLRKKAENDPRVSDDDKRDLKAYASELESVHAKFRAKAEAAIKGKDLRQRELVSMVEDRKPSQVVTPAQENAGNGNSAQQQTENNQGDAVTRTGAGNNTRSAA